MATPRDEVRERVLGLYAIVDASLTDDVVRTGRAFVDAGVRLLQLRCKGWPEEELLRAAAALAPVCRAAGATFLVNDSAEVAVAAGADGVHVGETDGSGAALRRILGPERILGRSTGSAAAIERALAEADYLAFGPVHDTPRLSRPKAVVGLDGLAAARALVPRTVPLVAIGGIRAGNLTAVRATGVDAWAVIGALHVADVAAAVSDLSGP